MIWPRALATTAVALAVGGALAAIFSAEVAAWWLAAAFAVHAIGEAIRLSRLHHWAALPRQRDLPMFTGAWDRVLERIGRFLDQERDAHAELTTELAQMHAAVDRLPDGLTLIDRFDHIEWRNVAAAELHGIFANGRPVHHFIRQPEFVEYLEGGEYSRPPVLALPARPGRLFELRLHAVGDGGRLLISRDITDQSKLDAMRRDFVASVSREIRTPVTVIGGAAEALLALELDEPTRRDYLATIRQHSRAMQRLVDDLLTLSSLESSDSPAAEEQVDLRAAVESLAGEARALSQDRHAIEVRLDAEPLVLASAIEIESAIRNLLTNAVRYTPEGGRITLEWRLRDGDGELTIRDTGIGIAPEHLPRLAERFYRVDQGRSRETGGTGLGLAIVKHVMNRHGGQLLIDSSFGEGSAFTLRFPARRLLAPVLPRAAPARAIASDDG